MKQKTLLFASIAVGLLAAILTRSYLATKNVEIARLKAQFVKDELRCDYLSSGGLTEAETFPEIPVKVTINEYVEISKFYSTPKSRSFVNGILDRLIKESAAEGRVRKTGKGLL